MAGGQRLISWFHPCSTSNVALNTRTCAHGPLMGHPNWVGCDNWPLFQYFFRFTCLRDGSRAATIGCTNLRTKQTSSNNGWHKGWFYLRNDPEFALPSYTGCSIAKSHRNWSDGPVKKEQEKMLKLHWVVLGRLRNAGITLAERWTSVERWDHLGGSDRAVPRSRSCATSEAAAPPLRHDGRQGPLGGDCDHSGAPVAARGSAAWRRRWGGHLIRGRCRGCSRCSSTRGRKNL
jgi:hypothetical protein